MEKAGDLLGIASRRVQGDLDRFKAFIEHTGTEPGRGEALSVILTISLNNQQQ